MTLAGLPSSPSAHRILVPRTLDLLLKALLKQHNLFFTLIIIHRRERIHLRACRDVGQAPTVSWRDFARALLGERLSLSHRPLIVIPALCPHYYTHRGTKRCNVIQH